MGTNGRSEQLDSDILSSVGDLIGQIPAHGEQLAQRHSFPTSSSRPCTPWTARWP